MLAHQERLQVFFDRRDHQVGALRKGGAAIPVEAVLIGQDLDDYQAETGRRGGNHLDVFDPRRRHAAHGALDFFLGRKLTLRQKSAGGECLE